METHGLHNSSSLILSFPWNRKTSPGSALIVSFLLSNHVIEVMNGKKKPNNQTIPDKKIKATTFKPKIKKKKTNKNRPYAS
jgi:hypothetical protein